MTTEAKIMIDDYCHHNIYGAQPIERAFGLRQSHSVDILLRAGCCLDVDNSRFRTAYCVSDRMDTTIAGHIMARRAQLLEIAQHKLGMYLDQHSVAFADSVVADICAALDAIQIPIHPSLRVDPGYKSIYSQGMIPLNSFDYFWHMGFNWHKCHDRVGFTPIMRKQYRWHDLIHSRKDSGFVETLYWLGERGFMQETAMDPMKLGLNVCATGYHYVGALFAGVLFRSGYGNDCHLISKTRQVLSQASEDDCQCWCNTEGHSCSPTKLFLITLLHEECSLSYYKHLILQHKLFDKVSGRDKLSTSIMETLRLLTFEALEMTHTCCYFDEFDEQGPCELIYEKSWGDKGIFCCDPASVSIIRSCETEQSRASLLEELMVEFTDHLLSIGPGPWAFARFIYTYWRRRIADLYEPNPNDVEGLLQHQTFQGLGASHTVRIGE